MKQLAFLVAVAAGFLVARPLPPAVTMANQLMAILGWGLVMLAAPTPALRASTWRAAAPLLVVYGIMAGACLASILSGGLPSPPGNGILGIILIAGAVTLHGTCAGASDPLGFFRPYAIALVVAGLGGAVIAVMQMYAVPWVDNVIVTLSSLRGRASGNVGQSNQFADSMLWGLIALVALSHGARTRLARTAWVPAGALMLFGIVLTGSRTGLLALLFTAVWGLADRNLDKRLRVGLCVAPFVALLMLAAVAAWGSSGHGSINPLDRGDAGITAFRSEIWKNCVALIREQPWLGVGWGQFNFAWSLTPFAERGAGLVDNAHDLALHLAVELGLPLALLIMAILVVAPLRALGRLWHVPGQVGVAGRAAVMIVVVIGLHSMTEYPLWYSYMLLPATWACGLALGAASRAREFAADAADTAEPAAIAAPLRAWRVLGLMMVVLAGSAWMDYSNVASVYLVKSGTPEFEERLQAAHRSPLYANMADYLDVTQHVARPESLPMLERSAHVLVNSRLLYAWSNLLQVQGQTDKARYLAARMREFKLPGAMQWFDVCSDPAVTVKPFQCLPPEHPVTWRDFR